MPLRHRLFVLCALLWATAAGAAQPGIVLNASQQAYLQAHPQVPLCVDPDWWPFEAIDETGRHVGMAAELIALASQRVGLQPVLRRTASWEESLQAAQRGECLALSLLNSTPDRDRWLIFTRPLISDPNVIITREEHPFISDLDALEGKTIALPRGTAMAERIAREFPHLTIVHTDSEREALGLVNERKVDMTLRSLIVAAHTIKQEGWFNLKISGQIPGYDNQLRMGVLKSEQTLRDILDLGIATLSPFERQQIIDRHIEMTVVTDVVTDYTLVAWLGAILAAVLITSLWWMRRLHALNRQLRTQALTDSLTGLPNRHASNAAFEQEVARARRYERPLAVILLDIDHFKRINDDFGHLTGDQVLIAFGRLIQGSLRNTDSLCRWGGEEFLVICHATALEPAWQLAERLLQTVRTHAFPCPRTVTVSAGVAALEPGDSVASLMQRADEALYDAKHSGRDRACLRPAPALPTE